MGAKCKNPILQEVVQPGENVLAGRVSYNSPTIGKVDAIPGPDDERGPAGPRCPPASACKVRRAICRSEPRSRRKGSKVSAKPLPATFLTITKGIQTPVPQRPSIQGMDQTFTVPIRLDLDNPLRQRDFIVAKCNNSVILGYMNGDVVAPIERIQRIAAKVLATHPAGRGLCLVGGFRYRLLNESAELQAILTTTGKVISRENRWRLLMFSAASCYRRSNDNWVTMVMYVQQPVLRQNRQGGATVELAFYRASRPGSRIEIPVDITQCRSPRYADGSYRGGHRVPDGVGCGHDREQDPCLPRPALLPGT